MVSFDDSLFNSNQQDNQQTVLCFVCRSPSKMNGGKIKGEPVCEDCHEEIKC